MNDFSFYLLLLDIKNEAVSKIESWASFEDYIETLCKKQDTSLRRQKGKYPDIVLSSGQGLEIKLLTDNPLKSINLNSTCPSNVYYMCVYHNGQEIENAAIIHGRNYFSPEMEKIKLLQQKTKIAQNPSLKYRFRLMWEVESPFKIYGPGFFIVDRAGGLIHI